MKCEIKLLESDYKRGQIRGCEILLNVGTCSILSIQRHFVTLHNCVDPETMNIKAGKASFR